MLAKNPSAKQKLIRLTGSSILRFSGTTFLTGIVKNIRYYYSSFPERVDWENEFLIPDPSSSVQFILTHDVDWLSCWNNLEKVLSWEEGLGLYSCVNFLTRGPYKYDVGFVRDRVVAAGHEVGLHGQWHDPALAYRKAKVIRKILEESISDLGIAPVLFRAPSLSSSPDLMIVLSELDIPADSSLPAWSPFYQACRWPAPYIYPGSELVEIPLVLQDDFLFREAKMTDEEALDFSLNLFNYLQRIGGCLTINVHPGIIIDHERFFKNFIENVVDSNATSSTISNITKSFSQ